MDLASQVATNLVHYNLWHDVNIHSHDGVHVLSGIPPNRLDEHDSEDHIEWVVPQTMDLKEMTMDTIGRWFDVVAKISCRPKRVTLAAVNEDSTVVYYFVHDGVVKPRQN